MLARQGSRIHKHLTCSYSLQCAPKIAFFHSTGQLQCQNVALWRWRKGAQQCHSVKTNTMKATQQDYTERTSNAIVPMALQRAPKIALFPSTGQLQCRNVALSRWRKGAQQCHSAKTNTMKATQQDCTEGTSNAVVPLPCCMHPK